MVVIMVKYIDIATETKQDIIDTVVDAIQVDVGDFSAQSNLKSLLAVLGAGWNTANKTLYAGIITDYLAHATHGLAAIKGYVDCLPAALNNITAENVRQSVCLTGDPASSIGKILYELYITRITAARAGYLANIDNANLKTIADISTLTSTEIGYLDEAISAAKTLTTATVDAIRKSVCLTGDTASSIGKILFTLNADWVNGGRLDLLIDAIKAKTDNLPGADFDESGNFTYTAAYGTNETDISALFTTALTGTDRRKYMVYIDLTAIEGDANFANLFIAVKTKIDGSNYRAIDRKIISKADIAAAAEPGIPIMIPSVAQDIQITFKLDVGLAGDKTVYYHYVKEALE